MRYLAVVVLLSQLLSAQPSQSPLPEPERRQWFRDAKFGIFIHWGVYSVIGRHEWSRNMFRIPQAEYDGYAKQFNPVKFDPDAWASLFKNAGAKYVVITSKHHDGFSIYRSKVSDYDMKITPYPGDPLKMLARATQKQGLRLGFYHSIMDWHHPDYTPKRAWEVKDPTTGDLNRYLEFMKAQLKELLTEYGDVAVLWFDGEWEHKTPGELHESEISDFIQTLQPNTLVNDRLWNRRAGNPANYGTPEQFVPATGSKDASGKAMLWESCVTINEDSWGYNKYETVFKTERDLIRLLIDVVSKGGNLLLNIGPNPDGTIRPEFITRLNAIGDWMKINGEAIYGTTANPFETLPFFGRATVKGNVLYLHVYQWPEGGKLIVPGLKNQVLSAELLDGQRKVAFHREGDRTLLDLPKSAPDETASVIKLMLDGPPQPVPYVLEPASNGTLTAGVESGEIETRFEQRAKKENFLNHVFITKWTRPDDIPTWKIHLPQGHTFSVDVTYGALDASKGTPYFVEFSGAATATAKGEVESTSNDLVFRPHRIGTITLPAGDYQLQVKAQNRPGVAAMTLEKVTLTPVAH